MKDENYIVLLIVAAREKADNAQKDTMIQNKALTAAYSDGWERTFGTKQLNNNLN